MSAKATAIFEADDKQFSAALLNINRKLLQFQQTIAKLAVGFEVLKKGAELVGQGIEHFTSALDKGGELLDLSNNTGIAVKDLAVLQQQFKLSGKAAEDVGPVMAKMMKGLETGAAAGTIKRLGLDMDDLRKKTPADQFRLIGEAINKLPDPAERATAAMEVFGKSGASLLAVFADGGFGQAAEQVGNQAELLNKDAALFDDISDKLATAGLKVQGFFVGVADRVAPVIKPLLDRFAALDLSSLGQQVGDFVALFIQAFQDGKLGEIVLTSMELSFAEVANFLLGLLTAIGNVIAQIDPCATVIEWSNVCLSCQNDTDGNLEPETFLLFTRDTRRSLKSFIQGYLRSNCLTKSLVRRGSQITFVMFELLDFWPSFSPLEIAGQKGIHMRSMRNPFQP